MRSAVLVVLAALLLVSCHAWTQEELVRHNELADQMFPKRFAAQALSSGMTAGANFRFAQLRDGESESSEDDEVDEEGSADEEESSGEGEGAKAHYTVGKGNYVYNKHRRSISISATKVVGDTKKDVIKKATSSDATDDSEADLSNIHRECPRKLCHANATCPFENGICCKGASVCCPAGGTCLNTEPPTCVHDSETEHNRCAEEECTEGSHCPHDKVATCCVGGNVCCPLDFKCRATNPPTCEKILSAAERRRHEKMEADLVAEKKKAIEDARQKRQAEHQAEVDAKNAAHSKELSATNAALEQKLKASSDKHQKEQLVKKIARNKKLEEQAAEHKTKAAAQAAEGKTKNAAQKARELKTKQEQNSKATEDKKRRDEEAKKKEDQQAADVAKRIGKHNENRQKANEVATKRKERGNIKIGTTVSIESFNYPGKYIRHKGGVGYVQAAKTRQDRLDATFVVVSGLSSKNNGHGHHHYVSLRSVQHPDYYLRHSGWVLRLHRNDKSQLFRDDATWRVTKGLIGNDQFISFESVNYPGRYLRHAGWVLRLHPKSSAMLYRKDATFRPVAPRFDQAEDNRKKAAEAQAKRNEQAAKHRARVARERHLKHQHEQRVKAQARAAAERRAKQHAERRHKHERQQKRHAEQRGKRSYRWHNVGHVCMYGRHAGGNPAFRINGNHDIRGFRVHYRGGRVSCNRHHYSHWGCNGHSTQMNVHITRRCGGWFCDVAPRRGLFHGISGPDRGGWYRGGGATHRRCSHGRWRWVLHHIHHWRRHWAWRIPHWRHARMRWYHTWRNRCFQSGANSPYVTLMGRRTIAHVRRSAVFYLQYGEVLHRYTLGDNAGRTCALVQAYMNSW